VAAGVRVGRWKLVHVQRDYTGRAEATLLYDLLADPGETEDVSASHPVVTFTLGQRLERELAARSASRLLRPPIVLEALGQQALAALGYLGD
jgi:hypothetical protein